VASGVTMGSNPMRSATGTSAGVRAFLRAYGSVGTRGHNAIWADEQS